MSTIKETAGPVVIPQAAHPIVHPQTIPQQVDYETEVNNYERFEQAKDKILKPGDWINFRGANGEEKKSLVKSGLYKLMRIAHISVDITGVRYFDGGPDHGFCVEVRCIATAPDGTRMPGIGVATEKEFAKEPKPGEPPRKKSRMTLHNRTATAETRAIVRAVGGRLAPEMRLADDLAEDEIPVAGKGGQSKSLPASQPSDGNTTQQEAKQCMCPPKKTTISEDGNCGNCNGYLTKNKLKVVEQLSSSPKEK